MAKNGTAAEKSRMVVGGLKAYYSMSRTRQAITRLAGPKEKGAHASALCCFAYDALNFKRMK
jgi:hypothetical protein